MNYDEDITEATQEEADGFYQQKAVDVKGPLFCKAHGHEGKFLFSYKKERYYHVLKGGMLCQHDVILRSKK